jgi:amidase
MATSSSSTQPALPPPPADGAGLVDQAALLAAGEVSSVELVERALARAEAVQRVANPFRLLLGERALSEAAAADQRRRGGDRSPLLGVPVVVKDDTDLAGTPTAFGCAGDFSPAPADAELVRRLRHAGAVVIAKTNTPELGQWPFTEGAAFGATRNPWSLRHSPGGSSGGTAAAVAAGVVAAGTGSDGAGSIRIPAAWCHLVGIKPPRGRVSTWPDAEAFCGLTTHGTLARTVADAAFLLDAVAGTVDGERHRLPDLAEPLERAASRTPAPLRIGVCLRPPFSLFPSSLDHDVRAAVERLAGVLAGLGHRVAPVPPPWGLIGLSFLPRSMVGLHEWERRVPDPQLLDRRTRANCRTGARMPRLLLRWARRSEGYWARRVGAVFDRCDVLLTPTTATGPFLIGAADGMTSWQTDRLVVGACPYAWPWNVLGWPAINVPAGFDRQGLPVGAQLLGPPAAESLLVSLAGQVEAVEDWGRARPPEPTAPDQP